MSGARERKNSPFFVMFILCFIAMYSVLNKISEYIYF